MGAGSQELVDQDAGAIGVGVALDPHLGKRGVDRQLAREARRVRVEHAGGDEAGGEPIDEEGGLRKVGRGVDALQNFTETITLPPLSLMPERPEIVKAAAARPTLGITLPRTPTDAVTKLVSGMYAGMS